MKTFRRDKLRRLVEAGRVECAGSYHFDDMYGESRDGAKAMPVAMKPADWHDMKEGVCYLTESDFTTNSGRAWLNENGTVTLIVHSNSNFDFRILDKARAPESLVRRMSCCIADGCGARYDMNEPESREDETLRPFWSKYCPKHRVTGKRYEAIVAKVA